MRTGSCLHYFLTMRLLLLATMAKLGWASNALDAAPSPAPTKAISFSKIGDGECRDAAGEPYNYVALFTQPLSTTDADVQAWCAAGSSPQSSMIGVMVWRGSSSTDWYCLYDAATGINFNNFSPPADTRQTTYIGAGAIANFDSSFPMVACYRNNVSRSKYFFFSLNRFPLSRCFSLLTALPNCLS